MGQNKNFMNSVQVRKPGRNPFNLSHDVKMSLDFGQLYPTLCLEMLPSSYVDLSCESMLRMMPMVAPIMHRSDVTMHYFFVPYRILWDNFENFINEQLVDDLPVAPPTLAINAGNFTKLDNYLGMPLATGTSGTETVMAFRWAAYQCVYNEWYRDQNLIDPINFKLVDGSNNVNTSLRQLRKRAWMHDYFTSALPTAQAGAPVELPISGDFNDVGVFRNEVGGGDTVLDGTPDDITVLNVESDDPVAAQQLYARTSDIEPQAVTINALRLAVRLQEWQERNIRGGKRYTEVLQAHFGIRPEDSRMQRPEYITGTKSSIKISEVLATATDMENEIPQGNMAGHGISYTNGYGKGYYAKEYGLVIGIMSVMPQTAYQNGIPRDLLKTDPLEYGWPTFSNIGERGILNRELFAYQLTGGDGVFGYTPQYSEYKYHNSRVVGALATDQLDHWHMGRIFETTPALNQTFIEMNYEDVNRIFAVDTGEDHLIAHIYHKIKAVHPLPIFGTPTL